ncbi:6,7-dimethyl-8-ribityllumazine synthase [Blastochloris viridis]|uniref:6,7-dimethyl-8-ribityllumazine synthase n=1 Tax=Blastochloris viridis TaxID=1079 RepID=A0A0H5BI98_BLAVI|nr:6,7-dimethyl-8-ribityllumazine synthase [Blastochloris viridis]ALK09954.1 6,7-dimethyl-8-ribityllumazine synthase 1 [Blastochloris viridis]BAS00137.1 6,7-dimethyl-8-ribityllumazine synthase [Blastochloris viridis]CUU42617.1 6,7-dimethyl-8-ribityllumazine synthase 1 [Blastochloris viridis]
MIVSSSRPAAEAEQPIADARVLLVEARFYDALADLLLDGALRRLRAAGVTVDCITVPGSLEIPPAVAIALATAAANGTPYDGVVALGCVIRGETSHYDIVASESARALMNLAVSRALPLANGILTVDNEAQAFERADPQRLDKGGHAASAVLTLLRLKRRLDGRECL